MLNPKLDQTTIPRKNIAAGMFLGGTFPTETLTVPKIKYKNMGTMTMTDDKKRIGMEGQGGRKHIRFKQLLATNYILR